MGCVNEFQINWTKLLDRATSPDVAMVTVCVSYRVVDCVRPGLCFQTHPSMLLNGHSILSHVRPIQKISRVELHPWLICVHYQTMSWGNITQTRGQGKRQVECSSLPLTHIGCRTRLTSETSLVPRHFPGCETSSKLDPGVFSVDIFLTLLPKNIVEWRQERVHVRERGNSRGTVLQGCVTGMCFLHIDKVVVEIIASHLPHSLPNGHRCTKVQSSSSDWLHSACTHTSDT